MGNPGVFDVAFVVEDGVHAVRGNLGEFSRLEVAEALNDLFARVHDKGPMSSDGFVERGASDDEESSGSVLSTNPSLDMGPLT